MLALFKFLDGETNDAIRLLRLFGQIICWFALLIIGLAMLGIWLLLKGQLPLLLPQLHLMPNLVELLFGVVVATAFFLFVGLVMLMAAGQFVAERQRLERIALSLPPPTFVPER